MECAEAAELSACGESATHAAVSNPIGFKIFPRNNRRCMQILRAKRGASLPRSLMRMKQSIRHVVHAGPAMRIGMQDCADNGEHQRHHKQRENHLGLLSVGQRITDDGANKRGARAIQNGVQNKQANEVSNWGRLARGNMWLGMLGIV